MVPTQAMISTVSHCCSRALDKSVTIQGSLMSMSKHKPALMPEKAGVSHTHKRDAKSRTRYLLC